MSGEGEANAPSPEVMREEFINIVLDNNPSCGKWRAANIVDEILNKQMAFYSQMADTELDTTNVEAAMVVQELAGLVGALIAQGAEVVEYMRDGNKWRTTATRARAAVVKLGEMMQ